MNNDNTMSSAMCLGKHVHSFLVKTGLDDDWDFLNAAEETAKPSGSGSGLFQTQVFGVTLGSMSSQLRGHMSNVGKFMGIPGKRIYHLLNVLKGQRFHF